MVSLVTHINGGLGMFAYMIESMLVALAIVIPVIL